MSDRPQSACGAALVALTSAAVLTSGYIHFYLYFEGGYRGISAESFAGLTISRAFALNAIVALVLAETLVASLSWPRLRAPVLVASVLFAVGTLAAYIISRTVGLLGFSESTTTTEAIIAIVAETTAIVAGVAALTVHPRRRRRLGSGAATTGRAARPPTPITR